MRPFRRVGGGHRAGLTRLERRLLAAEVAAARSVIAAAGAGPRDGALQRLLPDAYPDDPNAQAEFRRLTEPDLVEGKLAGLDLLADVLGRDPVVVAPAEVDRALSALGDIRILLAARLGIDDAAAADSLATIDPVSAPPDIAVAIVGYDIAGALQHSLVLSQMDGGLSGGAG